jgi:hypothetical protein
MFTYENSIKEFGETLASLIEVTKCEPHTGIVYLQECQKQDKQDLYTSYTLEICLNCISKNIDKWKKFSMLEQQLELDKQLLNKT